MKIGGMGEQALRIQVYELRRLHEIPGDVEILAVLPDLPRQHVTGYGEIPSAWVPHPKPAGGTSYLYLHIQHAYCFRGVEHGQVLTIENLDDFLKKYESLRRQEELWKNEKMSDHFPEHCSTHWVDNDT